MRFFAVGLFLLLAGCAGESIWASDEDVAKARYVHPGPKSITLVTVIRKASGSGGHLGLIVNASERVVFDPAGTWWNRAIPERNDVHFGMTDAALDLYLNYHARETYYVVTQTREVSPEVAELVLQAVKDYGAVPKTQCSMSIGKILRTIPGYEEIKPTLWPVRMMDQFAAIGDVTERKIFDDDSDDNTSVLAEQNLVTRALLP